MPDLRPRRNTRARSASPKRRNPDPDEAILNHKALLDPLHITCPPEVFEDLWNSISSWDGNGIASSLFQGPDYMVHIVLSSIIVAKRVNPTTMILTTMFKNIVITVL